MKRALCCLPSVVPFGVVCLAFLVPGADAQGPPKGGNDAARKALVDNTLTRPIFGRTPITDERVLDAMRTVPRHAFVPEAFSARAYDDTPIPIGEGQTISQPYIVAIMTQHLAIEADDRVLEIGTGSGYQAAVLAELASEVYTIEIVEALGKRAAAVLDTLGYDGIHTRIGDGYRGWPEAAPFDKIIVTAAPETLPQALLDQLKPGGRLIAPIGPEGGVQELTVYRKDEDGAVTHRVVDRVRFVPFTGEAQDER